MHSAKGMDSLDLWLHNIPPHFHGIAENSCATVSTSTRALISSFCSTTVRVKPAGENPGTPKAGLFRLEILLVKSIKRAPRHGKFTNVPASIHLCNTTTKKRGLAKIASGPFQGQTTWTSSKVTPTPQLTANAERD